MSNDGSGHGDLSGGGSVSVIIPAYEAANHLRGAIDSALGQQLPPEEVIVINDGSTDATDAVGKSHGSRIVYVQQSHAGQGAARNAGLAIAKGEFVAFLDADDFWRPEFLRTCVQFLRTHGDAVAVSTGLITQMFDGSHVIHPPELCGDGAVAREPFMIDRFFDAWARYDHVRTGSNVIRRSVIDKAGFQRVDLPITEDLEYWGYLATFGKWGFIPQPLWMGNSRRAAVAQGWIHKHRLRWRSCPDVESWEERIVPRLLPEQRQAFEIVRGRIALIYAQNKILGGARASARRIVRQYGAAMPTCSLTRILRLGIKGHWLGWQVACGIVQCHEWAKAAGLSLGWTP
jgi:glycosyltransferase involved in cell wall biosynthesis